MKYFKSEYWQDFDMDVTERKRREELWRQGDANYSKYFSTIKDAVPKRYLKHYMMHYGFHDYIVENIQLFQTNRNVTELEITLTHITSKIVVKYHFVEEYHFDILRDHSWLGGKMAWLYSELELLENGLWVHRISFGPNTEFEIRCRRFNTTIVSK